MALAHTYNHTHTHTYRYRRTRRLCIYNPKTGFSAHQQSVTGETGKDESNPASARGSGLGARCCTLTGSVHSRHDCKDKHRSNFNTDLRSRALVYLLLRCTTCSHSYSRYVEVHFLLENSIRAHIPMGFERNQDLTSCELFIASREYMHC